jgi:hypothetical protein
MLLDWSIEQERFTAVAYHRTLDAARKAFRRWHRRKRDDAIAAMMGKMWDQWSRLRIRGKDPERMVGTLIKWAIWWVRYDRRIAGRARNIDVFDFRSGLKRQLLSDEVGACPSDRADPENPWIDWELHSGDDPAELAIALETSGVTLAQWCDC